MIQKIRGLDTEIKVIAGLLVVVVVVAGIAIWAVIRADREWRAWCAAEGGIVLEDTSVRSTTSFDSKGNAVVGTTSITIQLCVVEGAVIDVRTT